MNRTFFFFLLFPPFFLSFFISFFFDTILRLYYLPSSYILAYHDPGLNLGFESKRFLFFHHFSHLPLALFCILGWALIDSLDTPV